MRSDKHSEEVLIERAVKTSIQTLYHKGLFGNYDNADEVSKKYLLFGEVSERRRPDLGELNDDHVIQRFYSKIRIEK